VSGPRGGWVGERTPRAVVRLGIRWPRTVLLVWAVVCALAVPGLVHLTVEISTQSVLDRAGVAWGRYQQSQEVFGGDEVIVVAVELASPFDPEGLDQVQRWSDAFEGLEGVRRVDSIFTQPVIRADAAGDLALTPATEGWRVDPRVDRGAIERRARLDRILPDSLFSHDGRTLAVNVVLERDPAVHYEALLGAVAREVAGATGVRVSGVPVFQRETSAQTRVELVSFGPLVVLAVGVLLSVTFRSTRAAVGVLGTGAAGTFLTFAAVGALGVAVSFTMVILPPVLLALSAAYGMHVLTAASVACRGGGGGEALARELEGVATPLMLSGLTTAIGFGSSAVSGIEAVRNVGTFGGLGVLLTLALTLTALPAFLTLAPLPARAPRGFDSLTRRLAPFLTRQARARGWLMLSGGAAVTALAAVGVARVEADTDATRWFREGTETRDDYDAIRRRLSGISPINIVVRASGAHGVLAPEVLFPIDELTASLAEHPDVGKAVSVADPLRQLHAALGTGGGPLPATAAMAEQYLLLLESIEQIDDLVSPDREQANIQLRLDENGSSRILALADEAERRWAEAGVPGTTAEATGVMYEFARAQHAISRGQMLGLGVALVAIVLVLLAAFRAPLNAALTLVPNTLPLLWIYGVMGFGGIPLDAGTVLVGSLALGIAVDDTVHLASAFFDRASGGGGGDALPGALEQVIPAVTYTTAIVGGAFLFLAGSDFTFVRNLGVLMASGIALCWIADLGLFPALLLRARPPKQRV